MSAACAAGARPRSLTAKIKHWRKTIRKKWSCPVCGYVYEGENPPAECPVCHVSGSKFTLQEGEMKLAAEHEYGISPRL